MKTETTLLAERLTQARSLQGDLRQKVADIPRNLSALDTDIERYVMALDVLSSLGGKTGKAATAAKEAQSATDSEPVEKRSLADMILEQVAAQSSGLTTGEIVAAVKRISKDAQYGSVVAVISRLVNKAGALRRDGKRLYVAK